MNYVQELNHVVCPSGRKPYTCLGVYNGMTFWPVKILVVVIEVGVDLTMTMQIQNQMQISVVI
jgi:hypothetical protein